MDITDLYLYSNNYPETNKGTFMGVFRRVVAVAAALVTAGAIGVAAEGRALADETQYEWLCSYSSSAETAPVCAYAQGSGAVIGMYPNPAPGMTNWYWEPFSQGYGTIRQANTQNCMQLNHAAGDIVIQATCSTSQSEEWEYGNAWQIRNEAYPSLCLTYNQSRQILDAVNCEANIPWFQQFYGIKGT